MSGMQGGPTPQVVIHNAPTPTPSNGLGVAGFVTSLVGLLLTCGLLCPLGFIFSLVALRKQPRGMAIAGAVIGGLGSLWFAIWGFAMVATFTGMSEAARAAREASERSSPASHGTAPEDTGAPGNPAPAGPGAQPPAAKKAEVSLVLLAKDYEPSDIHASPPQFRDYITFKYRYKNETERTITGCKGTVVFSDRFGDVIMRVGSKMEDTLKPGESVEVGRQIEFNQFKNDHVRLRDVELKDLRARLDVETVLYE